MAWDLSVDLIKATVQIEQPLGDGTRTVGTGFLISDPTSDGKPRTILVTAAHVFDKMPSFSAKIGYRIEGGDGVCRFDPETLKIRDGDHPLWVKHPTRDVAVMVVEAPPEFVKAAIPISYLAQDDTFNKFNLGPGDEMMALGFPRGLAANPAGFPILRSGRVASYPLAPATNFPTFLMDFSVFPGNSGGPVFMSNRQPTGAVSAADAGQNAGFIAGLLTQQVELNNERLEIGIVTQAKYIRETLALVTNPAAPVTITAQGPVVGAKAASAEEAARPE